MINLFDIYCKTYNTSRSKQQITTVQLTQLRPPQQQQADSQPFPLAFLTMTLIKVTLQRFFFLNMQSKYNYKYICVELMN